MATKKNDSQKRVGGVLALIAAGLFTGAGFLDFINPKVATILTAGAAGVAAVSEKLGGKKNSRIAE